MADQKFEERWENFRDLVEHLFLEPGRGSVEANVVWYPATDVYETQKELVVRMDVSGVSGDDIRILMKDRMLEVRGIRGEHDKDGRKTFHKMEIAMGPFARSIQVPPRFARAHAAASYTQGVLEIRLTARAKSGPLELRIEVE